MAVFLLHGSVEVGRQPAAVPLLRPFFKTSCSAFFHRNVVTYSASPDNRGDVAFKKAIRRFFLTLSHTGA